MFRAGSSKDGRMHRLPPPGGSKPFVSRTDVKRYYASIHCGIIGVDAPAVQSFQQRALRPATTHRTALGYRCRLG